LGPKGNNSGSEVGKGGDCKVSSRLRGGARCQAESSWEVRKKSTIASADEEKAGGEKKKKATQRSFQEKDGARK